MSVEVEIDSDKFPSLNYRRLHNRPVYSVVFDEKRDGGPDGDDWVDNLGFHVCWDGTSADGNGELAMSTCPFVVELAGNRFRDNNNEECSDFRWITPDQLLSMIQALNMAYQAYMMRHERADERPEELKEDADE